MQLCIYMYIFIYVYKVKAFKPEIEIKVHPIIIHLLSCGSA